MTTLEYFVTSQKDNLQEDSDADETLSLCDLPLEGNNSSCEESGSELPTADQDLFQFFTGFNTDTTRTSPRDIVFCGKVLATDSPAQNTLTDHLRRSRSTAKPVRVSSQYSLNYGKPNCEEAKMTRTTSVAQKTNDKKSLSKWFKRCDTSVEGILASATPAPVRPKLPLYMFGFAKAPAMELKDIRSRQSRMSPPSTLFPSIEMGRDGRKACWSLLRTLGRKGKVNGVMSASLGFLPRV